MARTEGAPPDPGALLELTVYDLGAQGDGIARLADGTPVFIAGALPGERIEARWTDAGKGPARAELVSVRNPGPDRAVPPCPHFGTCGGCAMQHLADDAYARWKAGQLAEALSREGIEAAVAPMIRVPAASRRRARLFGARTADGGVAGFQAVASHRIVDMRTCHVLAPPLFALVDPLRALFAELLPPGGRGEAEVQLVGSALDAVLRLPARLDMRLRERLAVFAGEAGIARLSVQPVPRGRGRLPAPEPVLEREPVRAEFGGIAVALPPLGFLQATAAGEAALVAAIMATVPEGARAVDLYAGAGTFTFPMLARARMVAAYEGDAPLVDAMTGAARAGGVGPRVTARRRDLARNPVPAEELKAFDLAVFDPPRGGAPAQAVEIAKSGIPVVAGVSCNPQSFARDAKALIDAGYRLESVVPVDQFAWTRHLELAAVFRR